MNNEHENLSRNDEKIRQILGSLEKIDAPKDFNFKLKSKIADAKSVRRNQGFWRYLLVGVPSLACILLAAFFVFNQKTPQKNDVSAVENNQIELPKSIQNQPISNEENKPLLSANNPNSVKVSASKEVVSKSPTVIEPKKIDEKIFAKVEQPNRVFIENKRVLPKKTKADDDFVGEKTSASTDTQKPITPKGLNGKPANAEINQNDTVFEIEGVLQTLGIETTEENGKLKVKSVNKISSAEKSGVKNNDVIDAINNEKIAPKEVRKKAVEVKSINVLRDGKVIELKVIN